MKKCIKNNWINEQPKIEFIQNLVGYEKINAYTDVRAIRQIKELMFNAGLYKSPLNAINESSITNLILKAQGKKAFANRKTKTSSRDARKQVADL
jgi:hypothetical protein